MGTVKKTLSIETDTWTFIQYAADQAGVSPSAWLSRAARQQAILQAYRGPAEAADVEAMFLADEEEAARAEEEQRAAG